MQNNPVQQPTAEQMLQHFGLALTYALYSRMEPDECYRELLRLVIERHSEKHDKSIDWRECKNKNCVSIQQVLNNKLMPTLILSPIAVQLMESFAIKLTPLGKHISEGFIVALREKEAAVAAQHPQPLQTELPKINSSGLKLIVK